MGNATNLLHQWNQGDPLARNQLIDLLYAELRAVAGRALAIHPNVQNLQPTELINEVILKLFPVQQPQWEDRAQFLGIAANAMRQVLVDQYRRASADKRAHLNMAYTTRSLPGVSPDTNLERVNEALDSLSKAAPELVSVVEMKFFAGMTNPEISHALDISESTVKRYWRSARAFLLAELDED